MTDESDRRAFEADIVKRLRRAAYVMFTDGYHSKDLAEEAAVCIEALERKVAELRALKSEPAPVPAAKPFIFADPSAQREWERQRREGK